jgi:2-amino-4-hydroxy-6-hydroxymethyldihydropteridine diphosphokinase
MMRTLTGRMPASLSADRRGAMTERRVRAYVGLGANLGDAETTLAAAVTALASLPGVRLRGVSRLYATAPVGLTDQPEFRNAAVALDVPAGADAAAGALWLLGRLKRLETEFGRRPRERWGPREIDLDLLIFGRARLAIERTRGTRSMDAGIDPDKAPKRLEVPHPAATTRLFVLAPLADLAPGLVPPGWGESVESARRRQVAIEGPMAVRPIGEWDPVAGRWRRLQPR